jgi:hypothetical protein
MPILWWPENEGAPISNQRSGKPPRPNRDRLDWLMLSATSAAAVGAVIAACFAVLQFCEEKYTQHKQLRAYVAAKSVYGAAERSLSGPKKFTYIDWENSGDTTASGIRLCAKLIDASGPKCENPTIPPIFLARHANTNAGRISISVDDFSTSNPRTLYWSVTYNDTFGCTHETRQAWKVYSTDLEQFLVDKLIPLNLVPADQYIYMDNSC